MPARLPLRYAALGVVILACLASLALAVGRIYMTERAIGRDIAESVVWSMTQSEVELHRLLDTLGRYGRGAPGAGREELMLRFDVLWSRLAVPAEGAAADRLAMVDGGPEALTRARDALAAAEPAVMELRPGDTAGAAAIEAELRPLAADLHAAAVAAQQAETVYEAGRERARQRELAAAIVVLGVGLVATGLLVALLIGTVRRSNALARLAREAEAAARLSEARLAGILENSTDWIWETDAANRFTRYAPSALANPAEQPEIVPGAHCCDLRMPEDTDDANWRRHAARVATRKPFRDFVYRYRSRGGAMRWARVHGRPVFDAGGAFLGYRGTGRDITPEREAEAAVREGRALLRAVIDAIPALVNVKDAEGRYILMNRFQAEVYGTDPEAAVGRVSADFTGPEYGGESLRLDREVIARGTGGPFYERAFVDAHGQRRVWWTAKQPLAGPDGTARHVLTVAMDITELKDSERARTNLSRYFSPNMVELLSGRDEPLGQVRAQQVAVIFADLFDFTRFSAHHPPEEVMQTLRDLHGRLTDIVLAHGGTLEKFLGDGIMATFGTPLPTGTDTTRALAATRDMVAMIRGWNAERAAAGREPLRIGIGAHVGPVLLGEVGSARRVEYAVVGGTVNLASRLQDMTRALRTPAVVSRDLLDAAATEGAEGARLVGLFESIAPQPVDGLDDPVAVAVLAAAEPAPADDPAAGERPAA